jgi:hypothetical protein
MGETMNKIILISFGFLIALLAIGFAVATSLTGCGSLTIPGGFYTVVNDIDAGGAGCFVISVDNISLNCAGQTISNSANAVSITPNVDGVTVKNCIFRNDTIGVGTSGTTYNLTIQDNVFNDTHATTNIYLGTSATGADIASNTFVTTGTANGTAIFIAGISSNTTYITSNVFTNKKLNVNHSANSASTQLLRSNVVTGGAFTFVGPTCPTVKMSGNFINSTNYFTDYTCALYLNETHGNYWADPFGFGFSQSCVDVNNDGVCDGAFTAYSGAVDYLPEKSFGVPVGNEPPLPFVKFMGVDESRSNFVFRVEMQDLEGGPVYQALLVQPQGIFFNSTNLFHQLAFANPADINEVTNTFCANISSQKFSAPGNLFGSDGYLFLNNTACVNPTTIMLSPIKTSDVVGNISFSSTFIFSPSVGSLTSGSVSIFSSSYQYVGQLLFDVNTAANQVNVSLPNGTLIATNATLASDYSMTVVAAYDKNAATMGWLVYNAVGTLLGSVTVASNVVIDVGIIVFNDYSTDGYTKVDDVTLYAVRDYPYPVYVFFDTLSPNNQSLWKDVRKPIENFTFGLYEVYAWATDTAHGQSYYVDPDYETFMYDNSTPALSDAQIADALNQLNSGGAVFGGGFVAGDIATDYLPQLYQFVGVRTAASRFLLGLILIIILTLLVSQAGSVAIIIVDSVAAVIFALPQIGLFPTWFLIVYVIIAAALGATALRKSSGSG